MCCCPRKVGAFDDDLPICQSGPHKLARGGDNELFDKPVLDTTFQLGTWGLRRTLDNPVQDFKVEELILEEYRSKINYLCDKVNTQHQLGAR